MRVCFDLDGTIAQNKVGLQTYEEVEPIEGAVQTMKEFKAAGFYIIIHTARNMATFDNNLGKIIAHQSPIVISWLAKWGIPYDELLFGKPNVDYFVDDKGFKFENWRDTKHFLIRNWNKRKI